MHKQLRTLIRSRIIEVVQNRYENFQNIRTFEDVVEELFIVVTEFPEKHQKLLMEMHFFCRVGQIRLHQWIVQ